MLVSLVAISRRFPSALFAFTEVDVGSLLETVFVFSCRIPCRLLILIVSALFESLCSSVSAPRCKDLLHILMGRSTVYQPKLERRIRNLVTSVQMQSAMCFQTVVADAFFLYSKSYVLRSSGFTIIVFVVLILVRIFLTDQIESPVSLHSKDS